jgi:Tfp pilus assembly protein PilV
MVIKLFLSEKGMENGGDTSVSPSACESPTAQNTMIRAKTELVHGLFMQTRNKNRILSDESGVVLLEVLVAILVAAVVVGLGAQLVYLSLRGNQSSIDQNVTNGLLEETFSGIRNSVAESWNDLYGVTKGSTAYHAEVSGTKWIIASGVQSVVLNDISYNRSFTVQNVCRDNTTKLIVGTTDSGGSSTTCTGISGSSHDPSTQKITAEIASANADTLSAIEYITRWPNVLCSQTSWSGTGSGPSTCPVTTYETQTNITTGTSLELCSGGC